MSSILKALKKLEEEKTLPQESPRANISRDILREKPAGRKMLVWISIAGIAALAIIITLSTLLFTKSPPRNEAAPAQPPQVMTKEGALPAAATAVVPGPVSSPQPVNGSSSATSTPAPLPASAEINRQQVKPTLPTLPQPAAEKALRTEMPDSHAALPESPRPESARKPSQTSVTEPTDPSLTLSGIAWNKDSAERLAIINGQPAAIGTSVSGAVVEEIMPDRVKVNSAGRSFEIYLGKPAKSN